MYDKFMIANHINANYSLIFITYLCAILIISLIRGISSIVSKEIDFIDYSYPIGKQLNCEKNVRIIFIKK